MFKKCKIVLLPSNEKSKLFIYKNDNILYNSQTEIENTNKRCKHQQLYILSDEEIKEEINDSEFVFYNALYHTFCEHPSEGVTTKANLKLWGMLLPDKFLKNIIATTDSTVKIIIPRHNDFDSEYNFPIIPQSFIDKYVSEYNAGRKITKIMVEYEMTDQLDPLEYEYPNDWFKVNPNNTIFIKWWQ